MKAVVGRPYKPLPQPVLVEAFWIDFNIGMINSTGYRHEGEKCYYRPVMHGQKENDNRYNQWLKQALSGMEWKTGPWWGDVAIVMRFVN